jgi:hypothetical protein
MEPWRLDAEHIEEWIALLVASAHRGWANDFETAGQPIGVERVGKLRGPGVTAPVLTSKRRGPGGRRPGPHQREDKSKHQVEFGGWIFWRYSEKS